MQNLLLDGGYNCDSISIWCSFDAPSSRLFIKGH